MKRKCKRCGKEFRTAFTLHTCHGRFRGGLDDSAAPDAELTRARAHVEYERPLDIPSSDMSEAIDAISALTSAIADSSDSSSSFDSSPSTPDFDPGGGSGGGGGASGDY